MNFFTANTYELGTYKLRHPRIHVMMNSPTRAHACSLPAFTLKPTEMSEIIVVAPLRK